MQKISKKLHNQHGASIILAMLLFLICSFVAAVTLSSAATNAKKYTDQRKQQQIYLSVSSAAQTLRDLISPIELRGTECKDVYSCEDTLTNGNWSNVTPDPEIQRAYLADNIATSKSLLVKSGDSKFAELLSTGAYVTYTYKTKYVSPETKNFVPWEKNLVITADHMDPVNATITMDIDYNITIVLKAVVDGIETSQYSMILKFQGSPQLTDTHDDPETGSFKCFHSGTETIIQPNGTSKSEYKSVSFDYKHDTETTKITWQENSIRKGGMGL